MLGFESRWGRPPPCLPEIDATAQPLALPGVKSAAGVAVAQLRGCRGVKGGGHLGRIGQWFGKVLYRGVIEEFPDWVSRVSEVSSGLAAMASENRI